MPHTPSDTRPFPSRCRDPIDDRDPDPAVAARCDAAAARFALYAGRRAGCGR